MATIERVGKTGENAEFVAPFAMVFLNAYERQQAITALLPSQNDCTAEGIAGSLVTEGIYVVRLESNEVRYTARVGVGELAGQTSFFAPAGSTLSIEHDETWEWQGETVGSVVLRLSGPE